MNHKHRKALHSLYDHPLSSNIAKQDIASVLRELGATVGSDHDGKLTVDLKGHSAHFQAHGHSLNKDDVVRIRKFLETCGIDAARDYPL